MRPVILYVLVLRSYFLVLVDILRYTLALELRLLRLSIQFSQQEYFQNVWPYRSHASLA